jgi:hypothetical protein
LSLDEIAQVRNCEIEKETTRIVEKRLDFAPRQHSSPQRFVYEAVLANHNITVLEHPPYSPDLATCNFYLFPKIKSVLKGTHFKNDGDPQQPFRK